MVIACPTITYKLYIYVCVYSVHTYKSDCDILQ